MKLRKNWVKADYGDVKTDNRNSDTSGQIKNGCDFISNKSNKTKSQKHDPSENNSNASLLVSIGAFDSHQLPHTANSLHQFGVWNIVERHKDEQDATEDDGWVVHETAFFVDIENDGGYFLVPVNLS